MNSKRKCIFVVEDSREIRDLIKILYESEGYRVELASEGREALAKLKAEADPPAVILLDLMMPGMNGFEFRAEQEKDPKISGVPVIVMTADASADIKAKKIRANGYLRKPVAASTFIKVAEKFCQ